MHAKQARVIHFTAATKQHNYRDQVDQIHECANIMFTALSTWGMHTVKVESFNSCSSISGTYLYSPNGPPQ